MGPPLLLDRLSILCRALLPDCSVIVHGSIALGGYTPDTSDLDLLVLSDMATDGLVDAVQVEWKHDPTNLDLRVVAYDVAAAPTRTPRMRLYVGVHDGQWEVERDIEEPDLVVEFSVCRQLGHTCSSARFPMSESTRLARLFSLGGRRSEMTRHITS